MSTVSESGSPRLPGDSNQGLKWNRSSHRGLLSVTTSGRNMEICNEMNMVS